MFNIPDGCKARINGQNFALVTLQRGDFGILKFDEALIVRELVSGFATSEIPYILKRREFDDRVTNRIQRGGYINDILRKIKKNELKKNILPFYQRIENWKPSKKQCIVSFKEFWKSNENLSTKSCTIESLETTSENIRIRIIVYLREVLKLYQPIEIDELSFCDLSF